MSYRVKATDLRHITLNETDTVASVLQNIAIILLTRQGTVPMYREFGLPMKFVDKPMQVARSMMIIEITEAVEEYEPRATVIDITFEIDPDVPGRYIPVVEVEIKNEQKPGISIHRD